MLLHRLTRCKILCCASFKFGFAELLLHLERYLQKTCEKMLAILGLQYSIENYLIHVEFQIFR